MLKLNQWEFPVPGRTEVILNEFNIYKADSRIFQRLSPAFLAVSTLAPDLSFEYCPRRSSSQKNTIVLQRNATLFHYLITYAVATTCLENVSVTSTIQF